MRSDRVALVTGAGSGIGRAVVRCLAGAEATVVVNDVSDNATGATVEELREAGAAVDALPFDVSDREQVGHAFDRIGHTYGRLDVLVNNAGVCPLATAGAVDPTEWDRVIAINLTGAFLCTEAGIPLLRRSEAGRIVNVSSVAGQSGGLLIGPHYAASKGGLLALTKSYARALAGDGVTVNAVAPAAVRTELVAGWDEEIQRSVVDATALRRWVSPQEAADVVGFLCSPQAGAVTGATYDVNAGMLMR